MSNDEWKELSNKLHYGLALAERRIEYRSAEAQKLIC